MEIILMYFYLSTMALIIAINMTIIILIYKLLSIEIKKIQKESKRINKQGNDIIQMYKQTKEMI